ncbi:MAG: hypothetical protein ABR555_15780 [Pyrinomonadaceae bacterium]
MQLVTTKLFFFVIVQLAIRSAFQSLDVEFHLLLYPAIDDAADCEVFLRPLRISASVRLPASD